ncbi:MAG: nitroreductase family protein [Mariprofundaceae bacterium]|nr:nitroreductase family protein [Mariprofundaceae bacterium]
MSQKQANPNAEIDNHLANRWSPRAFAANRAVERERLLSCLEAARWAPSCFGDEPWHFIVADRFSDDELSNWKNLLNCLDTKNREWAQHAPILIMACASQRFRQNDNPNRWAEYDTGQAMLSLCVQAISLGLVTHQIGGFDVEMARGHWGIPKDVQPMTITALGYLGDDAVLNEGLRTLENEPRKRRPMASLIFSQRWKESYFRQKD